MKGKVISMADKILNNDTRIFNEEKFLKDNELKDINGGTSNGPITDNGEMQGVGRNVKGRLSAFAAEANIQR